MERSQENHWDKVYTTKQPEEVSWTQDVPQTSIDFIESFNLPKTAKIIDIGGGDSKLVDCLLSAGYEDVTVLDISAAALERAQKRLGDKALKVKWIVSDVTKFIPQTSYVVWHDRATFHFLTTEPAIQKYIATASKSVKGYMTIGTFSDNGPEKCSGLPVRQYNEQSLEGELKKRV